MQALIKSTNVSVKIATERTLVHVLEIHTNPETLPQYLDTLTDAGNRKVLSEYARRVLTKLNPDSDSE